MNPFKRIKRLWKLSKKDPEALMNLTNEQINDLPDEDQKAVWLGEGTLEEWEEQQEKDKGFFKKPFGL